ncbi:biotin synthase BioB [Candidatus Providencia siddallii]|uniref:Biotin synthase n=1 Tax=Candidatus Providencia siddallii TaxID=1715285 RepID=A0ABP1CDW8_9GAMM
MKQLKQWTIEETNKLFLMPFFNLLFKAQSIHRKHFDPQQIQISALVSIKTGLCPEDCKYCAQSARYKTDLKSEKLMKIKEVIDYAKKAKQSGATRFCMGAAWRNPKESDMPYLEDVIKKVKKLGMETCMTLGMINFEQAKKLAKAGLDYYNHNLDTSKEYYNNIVTTRTYQDRLNTLENVRNVGIKLCSGGIIGLGEKINDRASLLVQLANLPKPPESIPINMLIKVKGTPASNNEEVDYFDFIRTIAVARILMPTSYVRLSAGRKYMNEQTQALCFMAGANSIFYGCKLLTANNNNENEDLILFKKLNINCKRIEFDKKDDDKKINQVLKNIDETQFYNAAN